MNIFKWVYCLFKGHDDLMFDVAFMPGEGERVVMSENGKFMAAGKFNHWSVTYENKLQYKLIICRHCGRAIYREWPRGHICDKNPEIKYNESEKHWMKPNCTSITYPHMGAK